jgi:phosphatidylinositol glycan class P protein
VLFLLWACVPEAALHTLGVTWYPSRWWALALPSWLCVAVVYAYLVYERCDGRGASDNERVSDCD